MTHHPCVYLASPYSDRRCRATAEAETAEAVAELARAGVSAWSPIVQGCAMTRADVVIREGWSHGDWMTWCLPWLARADALVLLMSEGWDRSRGVEIEETDAQARDLPVVYWDPGLMTAAHVAQAVRAALAPDGAHETAA